MKMNKTFSIDIDLIHALRKKRNQSATVCRALRVYMMDEDKELNMLQSFTTRRIALQLKNRPEIDETLRNLLEMWLRSE